jgi:hypothetical protein
VSLAGAWATFSAPLTRPEVATARMPRNGDISGCSRSWSLPR